MKKVSVWILVSVLLFLTACQPTVSPAPPTGGTTTTTADVTTTDGTTTTTVNTEEPSFDWAKHMPKMDGSTSTIPLEAGIRAALLGITQEEAEKQVDHNSTYGSYNGLLAGACDLILTVQMSDEQIQNALEKGVELEQVPVAAEGFVFVVNANNPVNALTQQQLRDIYAGKITNWKQVGGNDAPIAAYQRNETSGSQNYIKIFMGDTPLMEPVTEFVPTTMGQLMDAVAYYDNAENAIGYSVYTYAADMYGNGDEIKFIHVDGVEPTKETMADGSYPLVSCNYIVYSQAQPADSPVRKLTEWVLSDEGQRAVQAAGYVPLRPIEEEKEQLYSAVGTGVARPEGYVPSMLYYSVRDYMLDDDDRLFGLKNTDLQEEINAFIETTKKDMLGLTRYGTHVTVECINGYLSVVVYTSDDAPSNEKVQSKLYDLIAGKEIAYSDLFFQGEDFVPMLNRAVHRGLKRAEMENEVFGDYALELKKPFVGLHASHETFGLDRVLFGANSYHVNGYVTIDVPDLYENSVLSIPRDMGGVFEDGIEVKQYIWSAAPYKKAYPLMQGCSAELLDTQYYDTAVATKINDRLRELCAEELSEDYFSKYYHTTYTGAEGVEMGLSLLGGRWLEATAGLFYPFGADKELPSSYGANYYFDMQSGEEVTYEALLKDGWETVAQWYQTGEAYAEEYEFFTCDRNAVGVESVDAPTLSDWRFIGVTVIEDAVTLTFERFTERADYLWAELPLSYLG